MFVSFFVRTCVTCRIGNEYSEYFILAHLYANEDLFTVHIDTSLIQVIFFVTSLAQTVFRIDIITIGSNTSISAYKASTDHMTESFNPVVSLTTSP
jgi:hypothetical protein